MEMNGNEVIKISSDQPSATSTVHKSVTSLFMHLKFMRETKRKSQIHKEEMKQMSEVS